MEELSSELSSELSADVIRRRYTYNPLTGKFNITAPREDVFDPAVSEYMKEISDEEIDEIVGEIPQTGFVPDFMAREISEAEIDEIFNEE